MALITQITLIIITLITLISLITLITKNNSNDPKVLITLRSNESIDTYYIDIKTQGHAYRQKGREYVCE